MFEACHKCIEGLKCKDDYASLKSGYWWRWRNETYKVRYRRFIGNLLRSQPALGKNEVQYPYSIPTPYRCAIEDSCKGGLDSPCEIGYKGPLCSVCGFGYYKQFQLCKPCPSKSWIAGQLCIIAAIFVVIIVLSVWMGKKKNKNFEGEHSLIDTFLSKIKIAIGF